jgi:hypothetical protein
MKLDIRIDLANVAFGDVSGVETARIPRRQRKKRVRVERRNNDGN